MRKSFKQYLVKKYMLFHVNIAKSQNPFNACHVNKKSDREKLQLKRIGRVVKTANIL